jgi:hypothetical protein
MSITQKDKIIKQISLILVLSIFLCSCVPLTSGAKKTDTPDILSVPDVVIDSNMVNPTNDEQTMVEVEFNVSIPADSPTNVNLGLDVLDEVTGLALNILRYSMERIDNSHFVIRIPFTVGSVIKYRYTIESSPPIMESSPNGKPVRYRLYYVNSPGRVNDIVSTWNNQSYSGETGRLQGQVIDGVSLLPIPGLMVVMGGIRTFTASDGSFLIEGLIPGTHNLVVYSLDGFYAPFLQEAVIAASATTPAPIQLSPCNKIKVVFSVKPPVEHVSGVPIRLVGNIPILGNLFGDFEGGMNVLASRAPLMVEQSDGSYSLSLELPIGLDLEYKYTLGDGFWNAEHNNAGSFTLRHLIIPNHDIAQNDIIESWRSGSNGSVAFTVKVPENTPVGDVISIQFNPYSWTPPIPMWSLGDRQWMYVLYSPMNLLGDIGYRFCRNDQCGSADNISTQGLNAQGPVFHGSESSQSLQSEVKDWAWWQKESIPSKVVAEEIKPRGRDFVTGLEFAPDYQPSWLPYLNNSLTNAKDIGAKWVIVSPQWVYTNINPPVLEYVPENGIAWMDLVEIITQLKASGFKIALYPRTKFIRNSTDWWGSTRGDLGWWNGWFDRYRTFILTYADFLEQYGGDAIIIGEPGILPALPGNQFTDGAPSISLDNVNARWEMLIESIRAHFGGEIYWTFDYQGSEINLPPFVSRVDVVYVTVSTPLTTVSDPSPSEITIYFDEIIKNIKSIYVKFEKSVILGIGYPAARGAANGCIQTKDVCMPFENIYAHNTSPDIIDLQGQMNLYSGILASINKQTWINGVISRGYYPPVLLRDPTLSIHGKPAADVLWYWFPRLVKEP